MSRRLITAVAALTAQMLATGAFAQTPAPSPAPDGKALFQSRCAMCHGPGGMGTGLLARRVQPAELEKRTNLKPEYVFQYARRGLGNMPPVTPGEVSDAELKAIAAYLASGPGTAK